jgi:hypothetical protein
LPNPVVVLLSTKELNPIEGFSSERRHAASYGGRARLDHVVQWWRSAQQQAALDAPDALRGGSVD